jgi:hypothetical protein
MFKDSVVLIGAVDMWIKKQNRGNSPHRWGRDKNALPELGSGLVEKACIYPQPPCG